PRAGEEPQPDSAAAKAGEADAKTLGPKLAMPAAKAMVPAMKALPGQALPKKKGLPPVKAGEVGKAAADTSEGPRAVEEPEPDSATAKAGEADAKTLCPKLAMAASKATLQAPRCLSHPVVAKKAIAPLKAGGAGMPAADVKGEPGDGQPEEGRVLEEGGETEAKDAGPKLARPFAKARLVAPKGLSHPLLAKKSVGLVEAGESGKAAEDTEEGPPDREAGKPDAAAEVREVHAKSVGSKVALPPVKAMLLAPKGLSHPVVAKKAVAPVKTGDIGMFGTEISEVAAPSATLAKAVSRDLCKVATELLVQAPGGVSVPTLPVRVVTLEKPMEERQDNDVSQNEEAKAREPSEGGATTPTAEPLRKNAPKSNVLVGNLPVLVSPKRRVSVEELAMAKAKLGLTPVDETSIPRANGGDSGAPKAEGQPLTDGLGVCGVRVAVAGPPGAKLPSAPVVTASLIPRPAAVKQTEPTDDRKPFEVATAPVGCVSRPFTSQSGTQPQTPQLWQQSVKPATSPGFMSGNLAEVLKPGAFMAARVPTGSTRTRQESDQLAVPSATSVSRSIASREAQASPFAGATDQEASGWANSVELLTSGRLSVPESATGSATARTSLSSPGVRTALQKNADLRIEQNPPRGPPAESGSLSPSCSSYLELLAMSIPVAKRTALPPVGNSSRKIVANFREQATLLLQAEKAPQEPSGPPSPGGGTSRLSPFHRVFSDSARPFRTTSQGAYSHSGRLSGVPPTPESGSSGPNGAGEDSPSVEAKPTMLGKVIKTNGTALVPLPGPHERTLSRVLPGSLRSTPRAGKHQMKSQALGGPAPVLRLGKGGGAQPMREGVKEIDHVALDSVYVQGCPASLSDAFSNSLFPKVDLDAVSTGTCVFDLGPRAVMACSGPVYSMAHLFLPDSQRQIEDVEAQLQIAAEVEGAFGIYDAPDGVYPWGDSEVNTAGNNSTSVTKLPKVLFGAAVTAWNEMLVYRRPQLILLIGTDVKAWDVAVPRLVVDLVSLGNLSLGLDSPTARYMHDAHHLLQLFGSVRPVEDGTFSEEAKLPHTGLHSNGMRQDILLRFTVGVLDKEEFFLGPHFPCGCLRPLLGHDVASFSLTDEERERVATECADLLVQVLQLDESQVVAIIKTFLAVSILARENSCTSDESITMAAHLLGISASDLGGHFRTALESPHLGAANLGSAVARTLYRQLFQFIVARINAVLQHMSHTGNRAFNPYVRTPFSISVLAGPTELDALPTVSVGKLGCYTAQAVGLCFAFRRLLYLQKLLSLGKFALPDYLDGLGQFTPASVFSEAVLLPDSGLLPFVASGPKSKEDILTWFDDHGSSASSQNLNFFSWIFERVSDSHIEVSLPGDRIKLDVSEAAFSSQPLDPLIVNVCNFVIKQSEPIRRLRLSGITRNSGLQGSESHLLYASLQDAWNPLLDSRPIVLHRGTRDGWSSLSESLDAVQQWEQHGFPLFIVIKDLPKYCPNLFPQDCADDVDRLMHFLPAYIDIDGVLFGSSLLAVRSQEYEGLHRLQEEAAEVVAKRQAWLVEVMELDSEIRDIVSEQEHGGTQQMELATYRLRQPSPDLRTSLIPLSQWGTLQEAAKQNADILDLEDDHVSEYELPTPGAQRKYDCTSPALSPRLQQARVLQPGSSGKKHWEQGVERQQGEATKNSVRVPSHTSLKLNSQALATTPAGSSSVSVPSFHAGLPQLPTGSSVVMGRNQRAGYSSPTGDSHTLTDRIAPHPGAFGELPATPKPPAVAKVHFPRASGVAQQMQVPPRRYEATSERVQPKGVQLGASSALVQGATKNGKPPLISPVTEALASPRARQGIADRLLKASQGASVQNVDLEERQRLADERERLIHENELLQIENQRLTTENLRLENERLHEENLKLTRQQCRLKSSVASGDNHTVVDFVSTPTQAFEGSPAPVRKSPDAARTAPVSAMPTPKSPQESSEAQDRPQAPLSPAPDVSGVENRRAQESSMIAPTTVVPKTKNPPGGKPAGAAVETTPANGSSVTRLKAVAPKPKAPLSKASGGTVTEEKTAKDLSATPNAQTPEGVSTGEVDGTVVKDARAMESSATPAEAVAPPPEALSSGETDDMTVDATTAKELPVSPVAAVTPKKAATPPLSQIPRAKVPPAKEHAVVRYSHSPSPVVQQIEIEQAVEEPLSADSHTEQTFPQAEDVESIPEHAYDAGVDDAAADVTDLQNESGDLEEVETVSFEDDTDMLAKGMRAVWVQAAFSGVWKGVLYWPKHLEKLAKESQENSGASRVKQAGKASVELTASAFFNSFVDTAKATDERDRQLLVSAGPMGDFPQPRGTIHITRGKIRGREVGHVGHLAQSDSSGRHGYVSPPPGSPHGERRQRFGKTSLMRSSDYGGSPVPRDRQREDVPLQLIPGFLSFDSSGQGGPSVTSPGLNLSDFEGTWNGRVVWKPPAKEYGDAAQDLSTIILVDLTQPDGGVPDPRGPLHVFRSDNDGAPRPIVVPQTGETIAEKLQTIFSTIDVSGAGNVYFIPPNQSGVLAITAHSKHRDTGLCIQEPDDQITTFENYGERRRKEQHDDVMRRLEEADKECTFRPKLISGGGWRSTRKAAPEVSPSRTSGIPASRTSSSACTRLLTNSRDVTRE
ncbi:putative proteophosphoglycan ppg4, related protein, partial [Toxoplasma gondii GAB2-2007-GAL-DOM2]